VLGVSVCGVKIREEEERTMFKEVFVLAIGLVAFTFCAPNPQIPTPPMPPGMPTPPGEFFIQILWWFDTNYYWTQSGMPGFDKLMAQSLTRIARQAPPPPKGAPAPPSLSRVARQAPESTEPPKRVARQAIFESPEAPKQITKEAFYSSITTVEREKRDMMTRKGRWSNQYWVDPLKTGHGKILTKKRL
jgi:hypothetical protein